MLYITHRLTLKRVLSLTLISLLLAGCQTEQASDTKVVAHKVMNTSSGLSGFEFDIPEGYHRVKPESLEESEKGMLKYYETYIKYAQNNPNYDYQESMLFSDGSSLIIFTLARQRLNKPFSQMSDFQKSSILNNSMANWKTYWNTDIETRESGKYGSVQYSHITFPLDDNYVAEDYTALGSLRETYGFFGIAPKNKEKNLRLALMTTVMSLRY